MARVNRNLWRKVHLVVGLVAGLPLLAVGLTGAVLGFAPELQRWSQPDLHAVEALGEPMPIPELVRKLRAEHPATRLNHVMLHPRSQPRRWTAWVSEGSGPEQIGYVLHVDPYTGDIAKDTTGGGWMGWMERIHRSLGAGPIGRAIVAYSSLVLIPLSILGLYLWWPMRRKTVERAVRRREALAWHNLVGLVVFPLLILMAVTGLQQTWNGVLMPLVYTVTGSPPRPPEPKSEVLPGREPVTLAGAIETVQARFPGAVVSAFAEGGGDDGAYKVHLGYPGELNPQGWERVYVDRYSGRILSHWDTYAHSPASVWQQVWWQLHSGELFGTVGRAVWAFASAALAVLLFTGILAWWERRGRTRRRQRGRESMTAAATMVSDRDDVYRTEGRDARWDRIPGGR